MTDRSLLIVLACVIACLAVSPVQAQTQVVYVDSSNTAGTQNGDSWSEAYASLQNALADSRANGASAANTEIWIAEGAYFPYEGGSPASNRGESFTLTGNQDGLEIYGGFSGNESTRSARNPEANPTVLSGDIDGDDNTDEDMVPRGITDVQGDNSYNVLFLDGTSAAGNVTSSTVIDGVIVTAGQANGVLVTNANGGGLYCDGENSGNECSPTLRNVVFVFNKSNKEGGAVYGIGNSGGNVSPTIESGLFAGNQASNNGGAITLRGTANSTITNTIFNGNTVVAGNAGAIFTSADSDGNGISLNIINATLAGNSITGGDGGAVYADGSSESVAVDMRNTILAGNTASGSGNEVYSTGSDAIVDVASSIVLGGNTNPILVENNGGTIDYAGSNIDAPPRFSRPNSLRGPDGTLPSGDDGLAVLPGSPALDAGNNAALDITGNGTPDITADVKGTSRVQDGTVDIGAYEGPVVSRVFRVDADAGGSPPAADGLEWGSAFQHLQDALDVAVATDEIWLAEGAYFPDEGQSVSDNDDTESFTITGRKNGLEIYGGFQNGDPFSQRDPSAHPTVLSGDIDADNSGADNNKTDGVTRTASGIVGSNSNHVLVLDGGNTLGTNITPNITDATVLDGVTVTAGQADGSDPNDDGGGLYCDGGGSGNECSPTIETVRFVGNNADFGGALFASGNGGTSSPSIERVTFAVNNADVDGGAIYNDGQNGTSSPQIIDATFTGNTTTSGEGGAIHNYGANGTSSPRVINATFVNNSAELDGGAMYNDGKNSGTSSPQIINATFSVNSVRSGNGGALYNNGDNGTSSPQIINATFSGNTASGDGGALYNKGTSSGTSSPQITNTILWANSASSGAEIYNNATTSDGPVLTHTIIEGGVNGPGVGQEFTEDTNTDGGGNLALNPQFNGGASLSGDDGQLATVDDRLALGYDSPAFDAGTNAPFQSGGVAENVTTDLTGASRVQDLDGDGTGTVNIGAYEPVEPAPPTVSMKRVASVTGAGVSGTVNPRGAATSVRLRLYPTGSPDRDTLLQAGTRTGAVTQRVETTARSLAPTTEYTAKLETENAEGGPVTDALTFETPPAPALTESDDGKAIEMTYTTPGTGPVLTDTSVFARKGGGEGYQSLSISVAEGFTAGTEGQLRLQAQLPESLIGLRGVDYYAVVEEDADRYTVPVGGADPAANRPLHLPVSFEEWSPPDSITFAEEAYRMVSVPASGDIKTKLTETLGEYNPVEWRTLRWGASDGGYREFPDLNTKELGAGRGFWLVSRKGTRPKLTGGTTVDASTPTRVPLQAGWNQIGAPFGFSVPWDTVQVASGLSAAEVDGPYTFREGEYTREAALVPWKGYFVFSAEADTLVVPPVGTSASQSVGARAKASRKGAEAYTLTVEAVTDGARSETRLAVQSGAKGGRDAYDEAKPPSVRRGVEQAALEEIGGTVVTHARSAKPPSTGGGGKGQSWQLRLSAPSEKGASVRLRLREEGSVPGDGEAYVLDLTREQRVAAGTEVDLKAGETRRLKAIVGTKGYAEKASEGIDLTDLETTLRAGYPNPFEEAATIEYVLSEKQDVTIAVYDVLGRRVRTLVDGKKAAGVHAKRWEGKSRQGVPVGSGMYFVRMRAEETTETTKLVRVR